MTSRGKSHSAGGRGRSASQVARTVLLALMVLLAGCSAGTDGSGGSGGPDDASWRTSTDPVQTGGLAWATGSTVTLGDGTTLETGEPVRAFVVAGDGVFFVPTEGDGDDLQFVGGDLFFVAPGEEPVDTGLDVADDGLAASPDGTRLAVLDADYDTGAVVMRFFDLAGGEAYTSEDGVDTDHEDPVWLLLEAEAAILAADDEAVLARLTEGDYVYDWETGEGVPADEAASLPVRRTGGVDSPDGRRRIEQPDEGPDRVVGADGEQVRLSVGAPRWWLSWWADDETVVGNVVEGPGPPKKRVPGDVATLMTCVVTTGECTTYPESAGQLVVFPAGTTELPGIYLGEADQ